MIRLLLRVWRIFPNWVHILVTRIVRPKYVVGISAMVFDERGRILLFKHTYRKLAWGLPGGGLEHREQPRDAIVREFFEETGITIEVQRLLLAESSKFFHHISLVHLCKIIRGEFRESNEISEMQYFDVNDLPPMLFDERDMIRAVHKTLYETPAEGLS